jgi:hypothetical protein
VDELDEVPTQVLNAHDLEAGPPHVLDCLPVNVGESTCEPRSAASTVICLAVHLGAQHAGQHDPQDGIAQRGFCQALAPGHACRCPGAGSDGEHDDQAVPAEHQVADTEYDRTDVDSDHSGATYPTYQRKVSAATPATSLISSSIPIFLPTGPGINAFSVHLSLRRNTYCLLTPPDPVQALQNCHIGFKALSQWPAILIAVSEIEAVERTGQE